MKRLSYAQLGPVLLAWACNSVLGIEPGHLPEGDAGQGGTSGSDSADQTTGGRASGAGGAGNRHSGGASAAGHQELGGASLGVGGSANSAGNAGSGQTDAGAAPTGGVSGSTGALAAGAAQGGADGSSCIVGRTRCTRDGELETCSRAARWVYSETCPFACRPKQDGEDRYACGGECRPQQTECVDLATLRTCQDDGEWGDPEACERQACTGDPPACRGSCTPGSTYCEDGDLMTCDATGTPRAQSCAANDQACVEKPQGSGHFACGGECAPGSRRCLDNSVQLCSDQGGYDDVLDCTDENYTCRESAREASCYGECAPGERTCRDGAPYRCNEGTRVLDGTCTSTQVCRGGLCVPADHLVGNSTALEGSVVTYADNLLLCRLPPLEHDAALMYFRAIGGTVGGFPAFARMVLYADDGTGNGPGGAPVAQTAGSSFSLPADTPVAIDTSDVMPRLQSGVSYWVGITTLVRGQASEDSSVRGLSVPPASGVCRRIDFSFANVFPTWDQGPEPGIRVDTVDVNLFLEVRDLE